MRRHALGLAVGIPLALLVTVATAQRSGDAEQLFQAATHAELVEGDLDKAIRLYRDLLDRYPTDRAVAAQALVKLGACYQKIGRDEARGAYERVLRDYADQAGAVRIARAKLQELTGPASAKAPETTAGPTYRLVLEWFGAVREEVAHSPHQYDFAPDGRRFVFRKPVPEKKQTAQLFIANADGALVRPLLEDTGTWWGFHHPRWAPDGNRVAYLVHKAPYDAKGPWGIFVADVETGKAVQVGADFPDAHPPKDLVWTPDGREITYVISGAEGRPGVAREGIYTRSIATGDVRLVQSTPVHWSLRLGGYSPDGRWLVLHQMGELSSDERDIDVWLLPARGGAALKLTDGLGVHAQAAWAPEGGALYFVSDRSGDLNVWKIAIDSATGARKGHPQQVTFFTDGRVMHPRLFAAGRRMALSLSRSRTVIKVGSPAHPENARELTRGRAPHLSPDGRILYYIGEGPDQQGLFAMPTAGGAPSRLAATPPASGFDLSPDGRTLTYFARVGAATHLYTLSTSGGVPRMLVEGIATTDLVPFTPPRWSPDGSHIAYTQDQTLFTIPAAGGQPRKLAQLYAWQEWLWAPDGQSIGALAYAAPNDIAVFVVPAEGGAPRRLTEPAEREYKEGLTWHPDSRRLAYMIYVGAGGRDSEIREAHVDGTPTSTLLRVPDQWEYVGRWTPDGRRFLYLLPGIGGSGSWALHAFDPATATNRLYTENVAIGASGLAQGLLSWSADASVVAWAMLSTTSQLWIAENFR